MRLTILRSSSIALSHLPWYLASPAPEGYARRIHRRLAGEGHGRDALRLHPCSSSHRYRCTSAYVLPVPAEARMSSVHHAAIHGSSGFGAGAFTH